MSERTLIGRRIGNYEVTAKIGEGGMGAVYLGQHHDSLSSVARTITGVRWNGPRFFGLRPAGRAA